MRTNIGIKIGFALRQHRPIRGDAFDWDRNKADFKGGYIKTLRKVLVDAVSQGKI